MSQIKVWGTGRPLDGFTEDFVLTHARKMFPKAKSAQIARFIARKPFVITRVNDEAGAQRLIEGLAKSGIEASTAAPPPDQAPAPAEENLEQEDLDDVEPSPPPAKARSPLGKHAKWLVAAVALVAVVAAGGFVVVQQQRAQAQVAAEQAKAEAKAIADRAAKREAEALAQREAEMTAADKAAAAAREAERLDRKEAAVTEMTSKFAAGEYAQVIAMSEKFEAIYDTDPRVTKLEQEATYTLKEGARRGNFEAILDAPIKGSPRFAQLQDWARQVQERARAR
jgi:hypothetical protein